MNNESNQPKTDHNNIEFNQLINEKMNNDLKEKYRKILEEEYDIRRQEPKFKAFQSIKKWVLFAFATLIVLIGFGSVLNVTLHHDPGDDDTKVMVQQYIADHQVEIYHDTRSSSSEHLSIKQNAYEAFKKKDYATTLHLFNEIKERNAEDLFITGISLIKLNDFSGAINSFETSLNKLNKGDNYYHETKLYLVFSYVLNDQKNLASQLFQDLEKNSWEYGQLQQILG